MASTGMAPAPSSAVGNPTGNTTFVDKLPEEINEMKIKDEKVEKVSPHKSLYDVLSLLLASLAYPLLLLFLLSEARICKD